MLWKYTLHVYIIPSLYENFQWTKNFLKHAKVVVNRPKPVSCYQNKTDTTLNKPNVMKKSKY